jgi:F-type H+-transporting ATPase subunit delta
MRNHFGGRSRQSLVIARGFIDAAAKGSTADAASLLSSELFFITSVLNSNISLRRAINDPSRDAKSKAVLLKEIFGKSVGAPALNVITGVSELRWSASSDLVEVLEQLAIEAEASAANIANELDRVESELFTVARAISTSFELRSALITAGVEKAKSSLIDGLVGNNSSASTVKLVNHVVNNWRSRSIEAAFEDYQYALAARRNRLIAVVRTAAALTPAQYERLVGVLTQQLGQPVRVNVEVDPSVLGGLSVKFADELVDGTLVNRIASAGRALAGKSA